MSEQVLRRIDKDLTDRSDAMVERVQKAYPLVSIRRSDVLRMVVTRGLDELERDISTGRVR